MISVAEATERIVAACRFVGSEHVPIGDSAGRVLAGDVAARVDQPPAPVSAMDGYAVRALDVASVPIVLRVVGEAPAGHPFVGRVAAGETARIFTGGVVPEGADAVVIQEDAERSGDRVTIKEAAKMAQNVRRAGLDFHDGEILGTRGQRLTPRDLSLLAAADHPSVTVAKKPVVAIVATGDELSRPGEPRKAGGIVASSTYGLAAMVRAWGGEPRDLGIIADTTDAFATLPAHTRDADIIVTLGGASVGDHDLVKSALAPHGFALDFWKIAMRPGKPLIFGRLNDTPLLGLPGNPVSAMVCALLFLKPAIAAMQGAAFERVLLKAKLATDIPANGPREDYMRARIVVRDGETWAEPFQVQDSSMQKTLAQSDGLIVRAIGAPASKGGDTVDILRFDNC